MKKQTLFYQATMRRSNIIKSFLFDVFLSIASLPKLMLEVFIRKNFGERYFSAASAISVIFFMAVIPLMSDKLTDFFSRGYGYGDEPSFWFRYATWYVFTAAFAYFAYQRSQEVKRNPSVFDFSRFSLATGDIHPLFFGLRISGKRPSVRAIEIFYEPALFFIVGFVLMLIGQKLGNALMFCSIVYGFGYAAAYKKGDDFIMDKIDEMIINEELKAAFVDDLTSPNTRGVRFYTHKPSSKKLRQRLADSFMEETAHDRVETFAD